MGLWGFLWTKGTPNIFQGTRQHWLIFQENKGINLILGDRNVAIWKTPLSVSVHWPYAFVIFRRQSQCLDALLNIKKDANERKLIQAGCTNTAIYALNLWYVLYT